MGRGLLIVAGLLLASAGVALVWEGVVAPTAPTVAVSHDIPVAKLVGQ